MMLTKAQIDELQKALPKCKIISNPTKYPPNAPPASTGAGGLRVAGVQLRGGNRQVRTTVPPLAHRVTPVIAWSGGGASK